MNAQPKPKTKPPATLAEREAALADIGHRIMRTERDKAQALQNMNGARKMADAEAINLARQQIRKSAADLADLADALADARAAVDEAKADAHTQFNRNRLAVLLRLATEMVETSTALEKSTAHWAGARKAAIAAAAAFETELSRCAVGFDGFLSVATRLDARVELLLWLETDGQYGRARTHETPTQLRENRRASLALAAEDFRTLTLRAARGQLGIPSSEA
ncbi:MAG: hypothetical protein ACLPV8_25465 [Steroidobacteraceae bacterium]